MYPGIVMLPALEMGGVAVPFLELQIDKGGGKLFKRLFRRAFYGTTHLIRVDVMAQPGIGIAGHTVQTGGDDHSLQRSPPYPADAVRTGHDPERAPCGCGWRRSRSPFLGAHAAPDEVRGALMRF